MSFVFLRRRKIAALWPLAGMSLLLAGIHGCLNPVFLNQLSSGSVAPLAPGSTPFVHVLLVNNTADGTLDVRLGWTPEFQGLISGGFTGIAPQTQMGVLLACPIDQIGLGDPENILIPAVTVTRGELVVNIPASAFPFVFESGTDYFCGDTLVLTFIDDPTNGYGIRVISSRVDGASQTGPFSGPDTYQIVQALLIANGAITP